MIKEVLLIFKTHLDIGFSDYAPNVVKNYLESYIPNAIKRGYELKDTDTPYIWTTGSWIINEALKYDKDKTVEKAIKDGILTWHAMPFTPFTESMNKELFEYGLSISETLDKRFGKKTISAKCSDVPGHTKAIIPFFKERGIEFFHVGVNFAYPLPCEHKLFKWKNGDNEIVTLYARNYGEDFECGDFAVAFGFTGDNFGPQSKEGIKATYDYYKEKYPGAKVRAATLDDVALKMREIKDTLPVVTSEIGDMWIQNVGTDPQKVSLYRELLRYIEKNGIEGDVTDSLLVVPEHTWGGGYTFFPNYTAYTLADFAKLKNDPYKLSFEKTWLEQRDYIDKAQKALGTSFDYEVSLPALECYTEEETGELDFEISWQIFDHTDYARFVSKALMPDCAMDWWVTLDNTKFNLPRQKGGIFVPKAEKAYVKDDEKIIKFAFDEKIKKEQGLPDIYAKLKNNEYEILWFGKAESRIPQACWMKFKGQKEEGWQIRKLGEWIDAGDVIGNPLLSATDYGVTNGEVVIETIDAPLAAPYGRSLLDFEKNPKSQDMYFNLYNNVWGCNQAMWYSDDSKFRFRVIKKT